MRKLSGRRARQTHETQKRPAFQGPYPLVHKSRGQAVEKHVDDLFD
jgi:hypothetical protein